MPERRHGAYKRGERLARELVRFVETEFDSEEDAAEALRGAYDRLDRRTRLIRGLDPFPAGPGEDQDRSN
jgi:hypothetical protein